MTRNHQHFCLGRRVKLQLFSVGKENCNFIRIRGVRGFVWNYECTVQLFQMLLLDSSSGNAKYSAVAMILECFSKCEVILFLANRLAMQREQSNTRFHLVIA